MSMRRIRRIRRSLLCYYMGGPVASMLTGVVALIACGIPVIGGNPVLGLSTAAYAIISFLYGVQGLRPLRSSIYAGDGLMLRALLTSYDAARQQMAAHAVWMLKLRGIDRSQWNRRWIRVASLVTETQWNEYFLDWLAYEATPEPERAAECLEKCLAGFADLSPEDRDDVLNDLFLEAATFTALHRRDSSKARIWLDRVVDADRAWKLRRIRACTALLFAQGDSDAALVKWDEGLSYIRSLPDGDRTSRIMSDWLQWKNSITHPFIPAQT